MAGSHAMPRIHPPCVHAAKPLPSWRSKPPAEGLCAQLHSVSRGWPLLAVPVRLAEYGGASKHKQTKAKTSVFLYQSVTEGQAHKNATVVALSAQARQAARHARKQAQQLPKSAAGRAPGHQSIYEPASRSMWGGWRHEVAA